MGKITLAVIAMFCLALVSRADVSPVAQQNFYPKQIGSSDLLVHVSWEVTLKSLPEELNFTTYAIKDSKWQSVSQEGYSTDFSESQDSFGNYRMAYHLKPVEKQTVEYSRRVRISNYSGEAGAYARDFLNESQLIKITPEISLRASEIAGGSSSELERMVKLTDWVFQNMKYDLSIAYDFSYKGRFQDSDAIFKGKRGVCADYSHLLIAMLRSVQIPARFVSGFAYSGEKWVPHAWVEAWSNGKWIPLDPTYDEALILDATHLKLATGRDQADIKEEWAVLGDFDFSNLESQQIYSIAFMGTEQFSGLAKAEFSRLPQDTVGAGSLETVSVKLTNLRDEATAIPLHLNVPPGLNVSPVSDTLAFLPPLGQTEVSWQLIFPKDLDEGFVYNFPVELGGYLARISAKISASKNGQVNYGANLLVHELAQSQENSSLNLGVPLENIGNSEVNATIKVTFNNKIYSRDVSLQSGELASMDFSFPKSEYRYGQNPGQVVVEFSDGGATSRSFSFNVEAPKTAANAAPEPPEANPLFLGGIAFLVVAASAFLLLRSFKFSFKKEQPGDLDEYLQE